MKITVKDLKQNSFTFENLDINDSISCFAEKVKKEFNYCDGVKLIYCGKILDHTKFLYDYFKETNLSHVVCLPEKNKKESDNTNLNETQSVPHVNTPTNTPTNTPINTQANTPTNTYSVDELRAILLVFTKFIKVSPELFYMFCTNDMNFQSFIMSQNFSSQVLLPLIDTSTKVLTSIRNGVNVSIEIPIYGYHRNQSAQSAQSAQPAQSTQSAQPAQSAQSAQSTQSTQLEENEKNVFSEQDLQNIQELCELGFEQEHVIKAYILANFNKEMAAAILYDDE